MNLQCSDWEVYPPYTDLDKWIVGRTFDTVSSAAVDCEDQSPCFGASWDVDSEWDTKEQAETRQRTIKGTMSKVGYEMISAD